MEHKHAKIEGHRPNRHPPEAFIAVAAAFLPQSFRAESQVAQGGSSNALALADAYACIDIKNSTPKGKAVVFPLRSGKISCFSDFRHVPEEMLIYHNWFIGDKPVAQVELYLKPPQWSTYSSINLRESDKGTWRVEVTDKDNNLLKTVRFSVVD